MVRRGLVIAVCALLLAPAAHASSRQEMVFEDDDLLVYSSPETVDASMAELAALGVDRVRLPALWRALAPAQRPADPRDPAAYDLARLDYAVNSARAHGLAVMLNPRGGAPDWAQAPGRPAELEGYDAYRPSAREFGAFVTMLGRRYADVHSWTIWNEPNWRSLLEPQSVGRIPVAADLYRGLYRAARAGLGASGHGGDSILLGETAPLGERTPGLDNSLLPGVFYRRLFCLTVKLKPIKKGCRFGAPLRATGVAHHPYPVVAPPELRSPGRDEIRLADARKLERILDAAHRYRRLAGRRLPLWYTEFGYQTNPPDPYRGLPPARQAAWDVRAEFLAFRDPRVRSFDQFLLRDSPPQTQYGPSSPFYWSSYQTGLRFAGGAPKPALAAFRMPLLALGRGRYWGLVRPADGRTTVTFQRRVDGRWRRVARRRVRGYFTLRLGKGPLRMVWRGVASRPAVSR